jgi:glycosyltransferase involved in cell wall biosynthesis
MLSIIIITKNEELHIGQCLESVKWADEIIVLDSGSTDSTVSICKKYTSNVFETDWLGFGIQKQRALSKATGEWVLSIDADEIITSNLQAEIKDAIQSKQFNGYRIPFLSNFCGREIMHAGWYPDYHLRLFRRIYSEFSTDIVHENVKVVGNIGLLTSPILHDSYKDLNEVLVKINIYSTLNAIKLFNQGEKSSMSKAIFRSFWKFVQIYFIKAAFLDGTHGLMLSISSAEGVYYKYLKLLELQKNTN